MDNAHEAKWGTVLSQTSSLDVQVRNANFDTLSDPSASLFWHDWNVFKSSLKEIDDRVNSMFSSVSDDEIDSKYNEVAQLKSRFQSILTKLSMPQPDVPQSVPQTTQSQPKTGTPKTGGFYPAGSPPKQPPKQPEPERPKEPPLGTYGLLGVGIFGGLAVASGALLVFGPKLRTVIGPKRGG